MLLFKALLTRRSRFPFIHCKFFKQEFVCLICGYPYHKFNSLNDQPTQSIFKTHEKKYCYVLSNIVIIGTLKNFQAKSERVQDFINLWEVQQLQCDMYYEIDELYNLKVEFSIWFWFYHDYLNITVWK